MRAALTFSLFLGLLPEIFLPRSSFCVSVLSSSRGHFSFATFTPGGESGIPSSTVITPYELFAGSFSRTSLNYGERVSRNRAIHCILLNFPFSFSFFLSPIRFVVLRKESVVVIQLLRACRGSVEKPILQNILYDDFTSCTNSPNVSLD